MGMADQGQLPKVLAKRSKYATPTIPILLAAAWILILSNQDFESLIELVNILVTFSETTLVMSNLVIVPPHNPPCETTSSPPSQYAFGGLIEVASFVHLRRTRPDMPRGYRVPVSMWGMLFFFTPAVLLLCVLSMFASLVSWIGAIAVLGSGKSETPRIVDF